jgi:hypothetical protein
MRDMHLKLARSWATLRCWLFGSSDVARWSDPRSFDAEWDERARVAAALIPSGANVVEFGAGLRQLERFLHGGVNYTPSDVVDRGPGSVVIDLNSRPLPSLGDADTAVFCGVLEYVADLPEVVHWLSGWAHVCIASYNCAATSSFSPFRIAEVAKRSRSGWVNTFDEKELCARFATAGFQLVERRVWYENGDLEPMFVFRRTAATR